jgi:hypothetical protein
MRVAQLDSTDDWTFGNGLANYISDSAAIAQNVQTRLKSFAGDWFLDIDAHIDWDTIMGLKDNEDIIKNELVRVALSTEGVSKVTRINLDSLNGRTASFTIGYLDVFNIPQVIEVS